MKRAYKFVLALFCVLVVGSGFLWYRWHCWKGGRIVASEHFGVVSDLHCIIREYPVSGDPFTLSTSAYIYGCEVRRNRILVSAFAFGLDSFETDRCSIKIASRDEATFTLSNFRIRWSGERGRGYTWDVTEVGHGPFLSGRL